MRTSLLKITENVKCLQPLQGASSNVFILEHGEKVMLIDSGTREISKELGELLEGKTVEKVLLTHCHFDHVGNTIRKKSFAHEKDVENIFELNSFLYDFKPPSLLALKMQAIKFGQFVIQPIHTPGHTPGSVTYLEETNRILFSGDSLFADGLQGRTDLPLGNPEAYEKSLKTIHSLKYEVLCPGHGEIE